MLRAAEQAAQAPGRLEAASGMDALRGTIRDRFTAEDFRDLRDEGRP